MKAIVHIRSGSGDPHVVHFRLETGTRPVTYVDDGLSATALRLARGAVFFSDYDKRRIRPRPHQSGDKASRVPCQESAQRDQEKLAAPHRWPRSSIAAHVS